MIFSNRQLLQKLTAVAALSAAICFALVTPAGAASIVKLEMPVPTVTIYPGDPITQDLITMRRMRIRSRAVPSYHRSPRPIVGKVARRTLIAGRPIPVNSLRAPHLITEGDHVRVHFNVGGLSITGVGLALQSGRKGQMIGLRNLDSGITVRGRVVAAGIVSVGN